MAANSTRKITLIFCASLLLLCGVVFVLEKTHLINLYKKNIVLEADNKTLTTSKSESAQKNFSEGGNRTPQQANKNEGIVTDNNGNISNIPPADKWTKSASGAITLYTPVKGELLQSGSSLSGEANIAYVSFRLIDDVSGMISQGNLKVVNGRFSGIFNFKTTGSVGRLDIYSTEQDGSEMNSIEIPLRFK